MAVAALVQGMKGLFRVGTLGHGQFEGLPPIAQVQATQQADILVLEAFLQHLLPELCLQRLCQHAPLLFINFSQRLQHRTGCVQDDIRRHHAVSRKSAAAGRHDHTLHAQRLRQVHGVQSPGAAKAEKRIVPRVMAPGQ